jgi:von Willebrand factor type A domain
VNRYTPVNYYADDLIMEVERYNVMVDSWKVKIILESEEKFDQIYSRYRDLNIIIEKFENLHRATIEFTTGVEKDFVLYFSDVKGNDPRAKIESLPNDHNDIVVHYNFLPNINDVSPEEVIGFLKLKKWKHEVYAEKFLPLDMKDAQAEFIFIIDRSGSMEGSRIQNSIDSLISFISQTPEKSYINILHFGSKYSLHFGKSRQIESLDLKQVFNEIRQMRADYGGTEILESICAAINFPSIEKTPRMIILITDGEVTNPNQIISAVKKHNENMRFCTIGIGSGVSEFLIRGVAEAGKGLFAFVKDGDSIAEKTQFMIDNLISRYAYDITSEITCTLQNEKVVSKQDFKHFLGRNQKFEGFLYLQNSPEVDSCKVEITYHTLEKKFKHEIEIDGKKNLERGRFWHQIGYAALIEKKN